MTVINFVIKSPKKQLEARIGAWLFSKNPKEPLKDFKGLEQQYELDGEGREGGVSNIMCFAFFLSDSRVA